MRQNVWIWNHYATNMFFDQAGRHYWFAENLLKEGYKPTIFCASTNHFSDNHIDTKGSNYLVDSVNSIPFAFVNTPEYKGNGKKRVLNMISFYRGLFKTAKEYAKLNGKPDVILASSVHPLTLVAGIKIAKKYNVPCICEVRDLWPESIIEFNGLKKSSLIAKILYQGEKWIYKKADRLIFTIEGGADYIKDQGWDKGNRGPIDISKVHHINNGIDIEAFDYNVGSNVYEDNDLDDPDTFKVVYAGSIRKANNLKLIINAAKHIKDNGYDKIIFLIFGDGDEKEKLLKRCVDESIDNVIFKGKVEKKFIPSILSKANINILNYSNHEIWKYGGSQNKNFEYLASEKPILSTITMGYDIIEKYCAGISLKSQDPETISEAISSIFSMDEELYKEMAHNARSAAQDYDFRVLTKNLIDIVESI
jgi:glycosyltransferase involved in cell wall biosynthesis